MTDVDIEVFKHGQEEVLAILFTDTGKLARYQMFSLFRMNPVKLKAQESTRSLIGYDDEWTCWMSWSL